MSNVAALNFKKELAEAESIAAKRKAELAEVPELSIDEILSACKRELKSVSAPVFGKVFFYPMNIEEILEAERKIENGKMTAKALVDVLVGVLRKSDGTLKFSPEHAAALIDASPFAIFKIASAVMPSRKFSLASAEKK